MGQFTLTFQRSSLPQAVHSFPTRRSSDLGRAAGEVVGEAAPAAARGGAVGAGGTDADEGRGRCADRKSTRLNSSHSQISYAVFCLKKNVYVFFYCSPITHSSCLNGSTSRG